MAAKGFLAVIVLCYASVVLAAGDDAIVAPTASVGADVKADQRLFVSDGTQITVSTDTLAVGVLLLGLVALLIVVLPLLLGGGEEAATATSYAAPSTYAQDPYSASGRSVRSTFNILKALDKAATKFL